MLASQLIYTSWKNGNSTNKGYMVYSKSSDISESETSEILSVMKYNPPTSLPYTPTNEQIETLFPKNFAFFKLTSGRYCIAQSSYVGQDYTNRWGNYIIHAYVIETIDTIIPSNLIGTNIFRTKLTDDELNAPAAPASLPKVEISEVGAAITSDAMKQLLSNTTTKVLLEQLLQSVIDGINSDKRIVFSETYEKVELWIKAISIMLPRSILERFFFSTYSVENSPLITLSCVWQDSNGGSSGPGMFLNNVIQISSNYPSEIFCTDYVNHVSDLFINDYYSSIIYINDFNNTLIRYNTTDCDLVAKLTILKTGSLEGINNVSELKALLDIIAKNDKDAGSIFEKILLQIGIVENFQTDPDIISVYSTIFPFLSTESKSDLLMMLADSKVSSCYDDGEKLYNDIKAECPCEWKIALGFLIKNDFIDHLLSYKSVASTYFVLRVLIDVYGLVQDEHKEKIIAKMKPLYRDMVIRKDSNQYKGILELCSRLSTTKSNLGMKLYYSICEDDLSFFRNDIDYLFDYLLLAVNDGAYFWSVLCSVLSLYPETQYKCVVKYVSIISNMKNVDQLESYAAKYPKVKAFIDSTVVYEFENTKIKTIDDVKESFSRYVYKKYDNPSIEENVFNLFVQKLKDYLVSTNAKEQIKSSVDIWFLISGKTNLDEQKKNKVLSLLLFYMFDKKDLEVLNKNIDSKQLQAIRSDCNSNGIIFPVAAELLFEGKLFESSLTGNRKIMTYLLQKAEEGTLECLSEENTSEEFVDLFLEPIWGTVYGLYDENLSSDFSYLIDLFVKPFFEINSFKKTTLKCFKSYSNMVEVYINELLDYYIIKRGTQKKAIGEVIESYLLAHSTSKRNEIFNHLAESSEHLEVKKRYVNDFKQKHKSGWQIIFELFSSGKDNKNGKK